MAVAYRCEKYQGVTLVVQDGWLSIVWDATGDSYGGPVDTDAQVIEVSRLVIPALRAIAALRGIL